MMSSGSPPNYSDGVPVKISEKFRPPPRITVPQSVIQRLSQVDVSSRRQTYDFQLESNVLKHISEWKNVIDREKNDRQERIRTKDLARLKQIEEEQKVKLNEISYPNTDDLSSDEDEKQVEQPCRNVTESTIAKPIPGHFSPLNNTFDTILTPTPIFAIKKGLDANGQQIDNNIPKTTNHKTTFNYSEFENGMESNPFDNMELSAIDDINILAQVLNLNSPAAAATTIVKNDEEIVSKPETPYQQSTTATTTTVNHNSQPTSQTQEINSNNEYYRQYNNYYNYGTYTTPNNMVPTTSSNYSNLNENYINQRQEGVGYPQNNIPYDFFYNPNSQNVYAPSYGYNNYAYSNTFRPNNLANIPQNYGDQYGQQQPPVVIVETKSKSKSVPDIVKKLDDEIKESEMRRIRNSSQSDSTVKEEVKGNASILPPTSQTEYSQLPQASQMLVKRIHNMGFPVERVAKIVKKLGPDDKKVIEHLIPLSELLDLGFEEDRISDALLKYNNNKDKALDYLIS